jgi:hypothetical protein
VRGLDALGPGRRLLAFVPVLLVLGGLGATESDWGLVAACAGASALVGAWALTRRGRTEAGRAPRLWPASFVALAAFAYAALVLGDEGDLGLVPPVAIFTAFVVGFALGGIELRR